MWRALAPLRGRQRAVLVLRHCEGLDDEAIAETLNARSQHGPSGGAVLDGLHRRLTATPTPTTQAT